METAWGKASQVPSEQQEYSVFCLENVNKISHIFIILLMIMAQFSTMYYFFRHSSAIGTAKCLFKGTVRQNYIGPRVI
jgi:hypothetical protein